MNSEARKKLPEGAIVNAEVVVVQFLDPENGELRYSTWFEGDIPLSSALGLLELAKVDLIERVAEDDE